MKPVAVEYPGDKFEAAVETIPLQDARLRSSWGERLFRVVLTARQKLLEDEFAVVIRQ